MSLSRLSGLALLLATRTALAHPMGMPVPAHLLAGDYGVEASHRQAVQTWVGELWQEKEQRLQEGLEAKAMLRCGT